VTAEIGFEHNSWRELPDPEDEFVSAAVAAPTSPVGECIYCGSQEGLSREHVIPFALSGDLVLQAASCEECSQATKRFETRLLRGVLRQLRVHRDLRSRSKHRDAPRHYDLEVLRDGQTETVRLAAEDHPILVPFPRYSVPGFFRTNYDRGIQLEGVVGYSLGKDPRTLCEELGVDDIRVTQKFPAVDFAQLIAKIGWGFLVASGQHVDLAGTPEVLTDIRGVTDQIGRWVGTYPDSLVRRKRGTLHVVSIFRDQRLGVMHVGVQLFADYGTPHYGVVLGPLRP
jgi:hypothetical protein